MNRKQAARPENLCFIPRQGGDSSFRLAVRTAMLFTQPLSDGYRKIFRGEKQHGWLIILIHTVKVKNEWSYTSTSANSMPFTITQPQLTFSRLMTYIYIYIYIYICRTAPLTSRCCFLYIYSTNIRTEYFKHTAHSPFLPLQNAVYFIRLPFLVPVLFTF